MSYVPGSGPELSYYICQRICKSITVKSVYTGKYERCRACRSQAVYAFTRPADTPELLAIHAQGVALNPHQPKAAQVCVRCGLDFTGKQLPRWRADGKVCRECYFAESTQPDQDAGETWRDVATRRAQIESREQ